MDIVKQLLEVRINMKFWTNKGDTLARCEKAGVHLHAETEAEYQQKREDQWKDGQASGMNLERYGRRDAQGNIIYDPGVQITAGQDVKLYAFRRDLEEQGFKLVEFRLFTPYGGKPGACLFVSTYSKMNKPVRNLTENQVRLQDWFFNRIFGNVYVWRNFGGAQFDVPCASMHGGPDSDAISLHLYNDGRMIRMGSQQVVVEFENGNSTVIT